MIRIEAVNHIACHDHGTLLIEDETFDEVVVRALPHFALEYLNEMIKLNMNKII